MGKGGDTGMGPVELNQREDTASSDGFEYVHVDT